jgi:hypothetical protein
VALTSNPVHRACFLCAFTTIVFAVRLRLVYFSTRLCLGSGSPQEHFIFQSNIELLTTIATVFWARTEAHNFHLLEPRNSFQELSSSRVQINLRGRTYSILPLCSAPKATCIMHPYFKHPEMSGGSPIDCYSIKLLSPLASTSSPELLHSSNKGSTQELIFCYIQIVGSLYSKAEDLR